MKKNSIIKIMMITLMMMAAMMISSQFMYAAEKEPVNIVVNPTDLNYVTDYVVNDVIKEANLGKDTPYTLTIEDGVTHIGYNAFRYCNSNLKSVRLPDSVIEIRGEGAFSSNALIYVPNERVRKLAMGKGAYDHNVLVDNETTVTIGIIKSYAKGCTFSNTKIISRNSNVTIKAKAAKDWIFMGWYLSGSDKKISSNANYTFKATKSIVLLPRFAYKPKSKPTPNYKVTLKTANKKQGTVSTNKTVVKNKKVTIKATAKKGYKFKGWYIGKKKISNKAKYQYKVTKKVTLVAKFKKI